MKSMTINTSVTFGAAVAFLDRRRTDRYVLVLNCGTGTTKFQLYSRNEAGHVRPLYEYKPTDLAGHPQTSLSAIQTGVHHPSTGASLTKEAFISTATQWLSEFLAFLRLQDIREVVVAALITGPIRTTWEQAEDMERSRLEVAVSDILHTISPQINTITDTGTFFMTQVEEGTFEYKALETVVSSKTDTSSTHLVLGIGIGRGSTQLPYRTREGGICVATLATQGMQNHGLSRYLLVKATAEWIGPTGHVLMEDLILNVRNTVAKGHIPVIGLKSGALIAYTDQSRIDKGLHTILRTLLGRISAQGRSQGRCVARNENEEILWDLKLCEDTINETTCQDMRTAIWKYAANQIRI
jgi:hypothetical protein